MDTSGVGRFHSAGASAGAGATGDNILLRPHSQCDQSIPY